MNKFTHIQNRNNRKQKGRCGTSLVEVMVALTIFAIFIATSCKIMIVTRSTLDLARDHYTASNLAKDRIELTRTFDFNQLPELQEDALVINSEGVPDANGHFRRITDVTLVTSNLYEVAVTVGIKNRKTLKFAPSEQSVVTYVSKHL